jgi:protocatechuate 3,4-dioxygenase alpha subunit
MTPRHSKARVTVVTERIGLTPSQTVGPFLHLVLAWPDGPFVVPEGTAGGCWIHGQVLDGAGDVVIDALVETWQADGDGRYDTPGFRGFGRCPTDADGRWGIYTVKPAVIAEGGGGVQAPHVAVSVLARGLLDRVVTRIYFDDEADANVSDPVLALVDRARRPTLIAETTTEGYRFDIRLQGDDETVFFDV